MLGASALAAALLSILAVLPSVRPGPKPESITNILFFGSFTRMPEQQYVERMIEIVGDSRLVYEAFAHDIYQNGSVLAFKKYRLITMAYRVMLVGLTLSFIVFLGPTALKLAGF